MRIEHKSAFVSRNMLLARFLLSLRGFYIVQEVATGYWLCLRILLALRLAHVLFKDDLGIIEPCVWTLVDL